MTLLSFCDLPCRLASPIHPLSLRIKKSLIIRRIFMKGMKWVGLDPLIRQDKSHGLVHKAGWSLQEQWSGQSLSGRKGWDENRTAQGMNLKFKMTFRYACIYAWFCAHAHIHTDTQRPRFWSHKRTSVPLTSSPFLLHFPPMEMKGKAKCKDLRSTSLGIQGDSMDIPW